MRCRYCNIALEPSRTFIDSEFCCDDHRRSFEAEGVYPTQASETISPALAMLRKRFSPKPPQELPELVGSAAAAYERLTSERLTADKIRAEATQPEAEIPEPVYQEETVLEAEAEVPVYQEAYQAEDLAGEEVAAAPARSKRSADTGSWRWLVTTWKTAPRDLKLVSMMLPLVIFIGITGRVPKVPVQQLTPGNLNQVQTQVQKVVELQWKNVNQSISDRAAVAYADDFRSGLDAWESRSNLTRSWSYDNAGFVRPGPLAIFKPTVDLTDYRFEFLGEIDQKALGWAFRAQDLNNYYAMKFVVVRPGPLPLVHMVRYAVINGKEGPHTDKPLPITVRPDMLYRIQVNTRGSDFTIMAQGQVVDFWSDNRLSHGGVGFFSNRGERARLRWVEVSHQYDALGRLCAYLAPYGIEGRNGNVN